MSAHFTLGLAPGVRTVDALGRFRPRDAFRFEAPEPPPRARPSTIPAGTRLDGAGAVGLVVGPVDTPFLQSKQWNPEPRVSRGWAWRGSQSLAVDNFGFLFLPAFGEWVSGVLSDASEFRIGFWYAVLSGSCWGRLGVARGRARWVAGVLNAVGCAWECDGGRRRVWRKGCLRLRRGNAMGCKGSQSIGCGGFALGWFNVRNPGRLGGLRRIDLEGRSN